MNNIELASWYLYLDEPQKKLINTTQHFIKKINEEGKQPEYDYSFLVFGVAKAYEGFLKKFLLDLGLIPTQVYQGKHFRIGRASMNLAFLST